MHCMFRDHVSFIMLISYFSLSLFSHDNDIVTCDSCGLSVHEGKPPYIFSWQQATPTGCYGVPEDDGVDETQSNISSFSTIPWFCDPCKANVKNPVSLSSLSLTHSLTLFFFYPPFSPSLSLFIPLSFIPSPFPYSLSTPSLFFITYIY